VGRFEISFLLLSTPATLFVYRPRLEQDNQIVPDRLFSPHLQNRNAHL